MIQLVELGVDDRCNDAALHARLSQSPKARHTHHYVVLEDGSEVAFLALDQIPGVDYLVLYEMFVRSGIAAGESVPVCWAKSRAWPRLLATKRSRYRRGHWRRAILKKS